MEIDLLRAELERLFELDELFTMSRDLLGFDPDAVGGTAAKGSFVRALTAHCIEHDAFEALCEVVAVSKSGVNPDVAELGRRGAPAHDELELGDRLGPYLLTKKLGEGPAGITYIAHTEDGDVRLKVLRREATRDQRALKRFFALTRLVARVRHQGLPWRLRAWAVDDRYVIAQESVEGQPLSARVLKTGPMHLNEARELLRALLETLTTLHAERLAHGNLKLENVLSYRTADGAPRVLVLDACGDRLRTRVPSNGHVEPWSVSSPKTVAPEQLRGHAPTPSSDIYAFGAMLYELLTGKPPFGAGSIADAMVAHLSEKPRPPSAVAPRGWVTTQVDEFVLGLLAKEPKDRPESARAVLDLLNALGQPLASASTTASITEEEILARIEGVLGDPENEDAALALESAVGEGADAGRVADALLTAAERLAAASYEPGRPGSAKGLLFRAGRLFQEIPDRLDGAERAYAAIVSLDPEDGAAAARLDEIRQRLGKFEELIESLLGRADAAESGAERAEILFRIGRVYAADLGDAEQALVAVTGAFCEDPLSAEYASEVERLAGGNVASWEEVLGACNEASTREGTAEWKNPLFAKMGAWYRDRFARPDLALSCFQAILTTDPANEEALEGLTALYRKAQQWAELGMLLLRRAESTADPAKARELRCDAAALLETQLGDPAGAREIYGEIVLADPSHERATEALARLLEEARDYSGLVKLLDVQAALLRGDELVRAQCRIAELYEDRLNDDQEASRRYALVAAEEPLNVEALRGLDRLYSKAGRFLDLLGNLEQQIVVATTPRQKIALWERVAGVHDEEFLDHAQAAFALEQVLAMDPSHDAALTNLARHYRGLSRWEDLAALYERHLGLVGEPSRKFELALSLAEVFGDKLHAIDRAILAYERVVALDPEHASALSKLVELRETAGDEDAALAALDTLADKAESPDTKAEHLKRAAKLLEGRGDRGRAIERYKRALDACPSDAALSAALRAAYVAHGDPKAAAELLEREIAKAQGDGQKAKLTSELAVLLHTRIHDDKLAERAARRALDLDPTDTEALLVVGDVAFDDRRFVEAAASYEKLASRAETLEHATAVRVLERYVDSLAKSASTEKALEFIDTLSRLAPDDLAAMARVAEVTFDHGSPEKARALYENLLAGFAEQLTAAEKATATYRAGEAARREGKLDVAIAALESATDLDPSNLAPLVSLASAYEAKELWSQVVDAKTRQLDIAFGEARLALLVEIGEIAVGKLGDRTLATKSLVAALDERPNDRKLLARLMQLYSEEKDWQKLVDVVLKLAEFVDEPLQKAKYLHTAAMVTGREMRDYDQALAYYDQVSAIDPNNQKAVDEAIELLEEKGDYTAAVERLKEKARIASEAKDTPRMLEAFNALVPLYRDKLNRIGHTVDALEAAQTLEPDNRERTKALADMYAAYPERYMEKAVLAQVAMLRQNPYRVESYKLLRKLYTDAKRADPAWCLCQALYVLKLAEPDEERFFRRMRAEDPAYAQQVMTGDDWLERVFHVDADAMLTTLFALIEPAIVAVRGQSYEAFGFEANYAVDPSQHPYPLTQTMHYAAGVMGLALPPIFENQNDPSGLGFLHAHTPSIVLGSAALAADASPQALAFVAGRHLTYFRPGFYARQLVQSGTGLRSWLFAAIKMNVPQFPMAPDIEGPVRDAMAALERHLPIQLRDHLARVVSKLIQSGAALDLKRWVQGVDLTADRAGFILSHDLETAVEIVRASDESSSALSPQSRLKELVLYAISEPYFGLRDALKIGVGA